jgi:hypothetical protein
LKRATFTCWEKEGFGRLIHNRTRRRRNLHQINSINILVLLRATEQEAFLELEDPGVVQLPLEHAPLLVELENSI